MITEILFISLIGIFIILIIILKLNQVIQKQIRIEIKIKNLDKQLFRVTKAVNDYVRIKQ